MNNNDAVHESDDQADSADRSYWPFKLERIDDAEAICDQRHIIIDKNGQRLSMVRPCTVCRNPAHHGHRAYSSRVSVAAWIMDTGRIGDGKPLNYRAIANLYGELKSFCDLECYASYVLWSLYIPINATQRIASVVIVPTWCVERVFRSQEES